MNDTTAGIARQWLAAFNAHSLEDLLLLYADAAIHYSPKLKEQQPETGGLVKGKQAMRAWWQDALERLPTLHYELVALTPASGRVFMEYTRQVAGEPDLPVAELLEIEDGKIIFSRVYHG